MKRICLFVCLLLSGLYAVAMPPADSSARNMRHAPFVKNSIMVTGTTGFVNSYRSGYTVPVGFEKGEASGFVPLSGKVEYAASHHVSLAFAMAFNTTYFNSLQVYNTFSGPYLRNRRNKLRIFGGTISVAYHFTNLFSSPRIDPFITGGLALSNIQYSAFPQGDSTMQKTEHLLSPMLKAGIRYYISDQFSVYADAGYDKLSIVGLGVSCRFFHKGMSHRSAEPVPVQAD